MADAVSLPVASSSMCAQCQECVVACTLLAVVIVDSSGKICKYSRKAVKYLGYLPQVFGEVPVEAHLRDRAIEVDGSHVDVLVRPSSKYPDRYLVYFIPEDDHEFFHRGLVEHYQSQLFFDSGVDENGKVSWMFYPSSALTGDFLSVFSRAGATYVIVGDVEGSGVSAGLYAMYMVGLLETSVLQSASVMDALYAVNRRMARKKARRGVSVVVAVMWGGRAHVYTAGGPPPIVRGTLHSVPAIDQSTPLGLPSGFKAADLGVFDSDILLYTDGVYELKLGGVQRSVYSTWAEFVAKTPGIWTGKLSETVPAYFSAMGAVVVDDATVVRLCM